MTILVSSVNVMFQLKVRFVVEITEGIVIVLEAVTLSPETEYGNELIVSL